MRRPRLAALRRRLGLVGAMATATAISVLALPACAQSLPSGVTLGMSDVDLTQALPGLEKVRRPQRLAGGLVGRWHEADVEMLGLRGDEVFYVVHGRLERVEFVGSAPQDAAKLPACERIVDWGRDLYGPEVAADDAGTRSATWSTADAEVYVQCGGAHAGVRLVQALRAHPDASRL